MKRTAEQLEQQRQYQRRKYREVKEEKLKRNPKFCEFCGERFTVDDNMRFTVCSRKECREWWEEERLRRKIDQNERNQKAFLERLGEIEASEFQLQPDDWTQSKYEALQRELEKPNGWKCQRCGEELTGSRRYRCSICEAIVHNKLCDCRTDGDYLFDGSARNDLYDYATGG